MSMSEKELTPHMAVEVLLIEIANGKLSLGCSQTNPQQRSELAV